MAVPLHTTIADAKRQESALENDSSSLLASLEIPFQGETHNLSTIRGFYGNADRTVRAAAHQILILCPNIF